MPKSPQASAVSNSMVMGVVKARAWRRMVLPRQESMVTSATGTARPRTSRMSWCGCNATRPVRDMYTYGAAWGCIAP